VVDFGPSSPVRSQTLWHAVAYGVSAGAPALSRSPAPPPLRLLGYHGRSTRSTSTIAGRGAPGPAPDGRGGTVYLDEDQLFFQISLPAQAVPAVRWQALRSLLDRP